MPKFYCDYCDTYLTHDSPSVRKTHCSGRKHKENVKDYYQKWMEEQAQSLIDKTTAAFQQGKMPPTPFPGAPPPGGAMIPPPNLKNLAVCPTGLATADHVWPPASRDATNTPDGWSSNDAHDGWNGTTSTWNDGWSRYATSNGWPNADDAWTSHDATSRSPNDDAANDGTARPINSPDSLKHTMGLFHMISKSYFLTYKICLIRKIDC
uniref:U1 small nuclear ribonucleoprotein C n=1 Tax=Oncorhynchus tshawytscha TaxID=74940 RepID=A0AAZ3PXS4_ONCTS